MSYYIGEFPIDDILKGLDKIAVKEAMANTGMIYTQVKPVKRDGDIVAMRIWVCDIQKLYSLDKKREELF